MEVTPAQREALSQITAGLAAPLTIRAYRCGKANCRCHADPLPDRPEHRDWPPPPHTQTAAAACPQPRRAREKQHSEHEPQAEEPPHPAAEMTDPRATISTKPKRE
jgi:hypothetical protein